MLNKNSAIIWRGKSLINGEPIVAIISGLVKPSDNDKTGKMAQVDILVEDVHPIEAIKTGEDEAICGDCPLRLADGKRICYVTLFFGPSSKWNAMKRGSYPEMSPEEAGLIIKAKGIGIRDGAYGDPAGVPLDIWQRLHTAAGTFHTSYTHQWARDDFDSGIFKYAMASVDHINTVEKLRELHPTARYYRMAKDYNDIDKATEVKCPSDKNQRNPDGTRRVTCANCQLCQGNSIQAKNVVIVKGG